MKNDNGYTLIEMIVAILLFGILTSISATFLVQANEQIRDITEAERIERKYVQFNNDFSTAFDRVIAIRQIGVTGGTAALPTRKNLRFDFADPIAQCMAFEVQTKNGKPDASFTANVDYVTWRRGAIVTTIGGSTPSCTRNPSATTYVNWQPERWSLNPPEFKYFDNTNTSDPKNFTTAMPTLYTSASWDDIAYAKITRLEYTQNAKDKTTSSTTAGFAMPYAEAAPIYTP